MRIAIGADHAGYELKQVVAAYVARLEHEVIDLGTASPTTPVDYPDFAEAVGLALREQRADRGIVICGSGVGASVAAFSGEQLKSLRVDSIGELAQLTPNVEFKKQWGSKGNASLFYVRGIGQAEAIRGGEVQAAGVEDEGTDPIGIKCVLVA